MVNKFLLARYKFISDMRLKKVGFKYSSFRPFIKNEERIQTSKVTRTSRYIDQDELD